MFITKSLFKVTFDHTLTNGTNSCWFKVKKTSLTYAVKYWRAQRGFRYLKIYPKFENGSIGGQTGFITLTTYLYNP